MAGLPGEGQRMLRPLGALAMAAVLLGGCTGEPPASVPVAETEGPLPEGHVECPQPLEAALPQAQCVAPEHAQRLGASCSADGTCVLRLGPEASGFPLQGDIPIACSDWTTPPCVSRPISPTSSVRQFIDAEGRVFGGGTP